MANAIDITETEEWRDIPGWEGLYQASSLGRIKSLPRTIRIGGGHSRTTKERVMKPGTHRGYRKVTLHRPNAEDKAEWVHRLVCQTFHPRPEGDSIVAHNDGDQTHNAASNVRWATTLENVLDKWKHGTAIEGEDCRHAILTAAEVREIRGSVRRLINGAAQVHGVSYATIADIVHKRTWKHLK